MTDKPVHPDDQALEQRHHVDPLKRIVTFVVPVHRGTIRFWDATFEALTISRPAEVDAILLDHGIDQHQIDQARSTVHQMDGTTSPTSWPANP